MLERLKFWIVSTLLGIFFSLAMAGGGWAWTSLNNRVNDIQEKQEVRTERLKSVEVKVEVLTEGQKEIKELLLRIDDKLDKVKR